MEAILTTLMARVVFNITGSLLLESKINPNTAYQKQQVSAWHGEVY